MLFAYNVDDLPALAAALRAEREDVLLALDEEGGDVTRLEWREGSSYPSAAALGALDEPALTEEVAAAIAADLAAAGVNWNFAPVADVNVPANPVIGVRSFGSDAALVARHVAAAVRGTQRLGVAACAKHFPGHGSTVEDSHLALPALVGADRGRARAVPRGDRGRRRVDHDRAHQGERRRRDARPGDRSTTCCASSSGSTARSSPTRSR